MEKSTNEGESPVRHLQSPVYGVLSKSHVPRAWSAKGGKFHLKLNIGLRPIANKYHEGKMKRTLEGMLAGSSKGEAMLAGSGKRACWYASRLRQGCL